MSTEVVIKDFERTEALESYLLVHTESMVMRYLHHERDVNLKVKVSEDSHRNGNRIPHFSCEIFLTIGSAKTPIKVIRSGYDFYGCVNEANHILKKILRARSAKRIHRKRHEQNLSASALELNYETNLDAAAAS